MTFTEEQASKLQRAEEVLGYSFSNKQLILSAITHPSATEGRAVKYSYERLEFLGDSILGAIVADVAFERFHELDEDGITPTYKLVETQGPPHDRTFVAQVFAGNQGLARGTGRTKKEAESQAAKSTLSRLGEFFGLGMDEQARAEKAAAAKQAKADKAAARAEEKARKKHERELHKSMKQG